MYIDMVNCPLCSKKDASQYVLQVGTGHTLDWKLYVNHDFWSIKAVALDGKNIGSFGVYPHMNFQSPKQSYQMNDGSALTVLRNSPNDLYMGVSVVNQTLVSQGKAVLNLK